MKMHTHGGDIYRHTNVMDFSANCNPLGTPQAVKDAISAASGQIANYPDVQCDRLREALAEYEQVKKDHIICGNGAADLIFALALAGHPKKALLPAPTFAEYEQALRTVDCEIVYYRMKEETGFVIGEEIFSRITEDIDMIYLCNPNNPTGLLRPRSFLEKLLDCCREKQVLLVLDECFVDFIPKPEDFTMKGYLDRYSNLFILKAFTKRYAMAGVRLGYGLCGNKRLLEDIQCVTQPWSVSVLAQEAGIAALKERAYVQRAMDMIREENPYLKEQMIKLGFTVFDSQANYIFFHGPKGLQKYCLEKGVMIRDCSNYEGLSQGYYRIAVRTRKENDILLQVFSQAVRELA